ncbi:universal stress protein [Streptomyces sp. GESEQ-35]|uniref:universal stress protein n=1 Tax=Streptomyces sp. GESEQ-35 TaxID=2812657 RepID=UPI0027E239D2|nr:universal stress protein [Streptomyces sp. GESEQ-35]
MEAAPEGLRAKNGEAMSVPCRIVVGVNGSPRSRTALRRAAVEARQRHAELWPVLAWEPPGGEPAALRSPGTSVPAEDVKRLAARQLLATLRDVFGDGAQDLPPPHHLVRHPATPGAGCSPSI